MPRATQFERSKAKRLRRRKSPLTEADRSWLDVYTREHPSPRYGAPEQPAGPPPPHESSSKPLLDSSPRVNGNGAGSPSPAFAPTLAAPPPTSPPAVPTPSHSPAGGDVTLSAGFFRSGPPGAAPAPASPQAGAQAAPLAVCNIKDCPRCAQAATLQTCGTTGETVHPPMDEAGANGAAALVFLVGALIVYIARRKTAPPPTEQERRHMANACRNVVYRRFNVAGSVSDVLGLGWAFSAYTMRAMKEAGQ